MPILPRTNLRDLARNAHEFARSFPSFAARLAQPVADPATERLAEGVAYLAGTVLDSVEDHLTAAHTNLAERASPWLRRPLPGATVVAFEEGEASIPASTLLTSALTSGVTCTFRPTRSVPLVACRVRQASLEARPGRPPVLLVELASTSDVPLNDVIGRGVSLFFGGELENALTLVHALTAHLDTVHATSSDWPEPVPLEHGHVTRGGFRPNETIAPDPDGPPSAFGIVTEALVSPDRFRFVEVVGLDACTRRKSTAAITLVFALSEALPPRTYLGRDDVQTNCATVTNIFEASAEPMALDFEERPRPLRVAGLPHHAGSVYAVVDAWATALNGAHGPVRLPDLRRLGAAKLVGASPAAFAASAVEGPDGVPLSTMAFAPMGPNDAASTPRVVTTTVLATNGAAGGSLRVGDLAGHVEIDGRLIRFRNIVASSPYIPPPSGNSFALRAVRHASIPLGRARLADALRDTLHLAIPSRAESAAAMWARVEGIRAFEIGTARRLTADRAVRHGYAYRLTVDESGYQGPGDMGLFGAAIGEALARSAPVNTFAELTVVGLKTGSMARYRGLS